MIEMNIQIKREDLSEKEYNYMTEDAPVVKTKRNGIKVFIDGREYLWTSDFCDKDKIKTQEHQLESIIDCLRNEILKKWESI